MGGAGDGTCGSGDSDVLARVRGKATAAKGYGLWAGSGQSWAKRKEKRGREE